MHSIEIKFLFEGVIFTASLHILPAEKGSIEMIVSFSNKYLINQFSRSYKFVLQNKRFNSIFIKGERESAFIKSIQSSILKHPDITPQ